MTDTNSSTDSEAEAPASISAAAEEAEEAAADEQRRQEAAAAGLEPDGPSSQSLVGEEGDLDGETDAGVPLSDGSSGDVAEGSSASAATGGSEGSGGSSLFQELEANDEEDSESAELATPQELSDELVTFAAKVAALGADAGGGEPGLGELGGGAHFAAPTVADDENVQQATQNPDGSTTVTTHYGGVGPDEDGNTTTSSVTTDPETGETTTTFATKKADGSGASTTVTTDADGNAVSTKTTTTEATGRWTSVVTKQDGTTVVTEMDSNQAFKVTTIRPGAEPVVETNPDFRPVVKATPGDPGPEGGDVVPGGRSELHVEELKGLAPPDTGSGDVDPADHEPSSDDSEPIWSETPGVDDPPDEQDASGPVGGRPDQSGWDVDPSEEDDTGGAPGPSQDITDAVPSPPLELDPEAVVGGETNAGGHTEDEPLTLIEMADTSRTPDAGANLRNQLADLGSDEPVEPAGVGPQMAAVGEVNLGDEPVEPAGVGPQMAAVGEVNLGDEPVEPADLSAREFIALSDQTVSRASDPAHLDGLSEQAEPAADPSDTVDVPFLPVDARPVERFASRAPDVRFGTDMAQTRANPSDEGIPEAAASDVTGAEPAPPVMFTAEPVEARLAPPVQEEAPVIETEAEKLPVEPDDGLLADRIASRPIGDMDELDIELPE